MRFLLSMFLAFWSSGAVLAFGTALAQNPDDEIPEIIVSTGPHGRHLLVEEASFAGRAEEMGGPFQINLTLKPETLDFETIFLSVSGRTLKYDTVSLPSLTLLDVSFLYLNVDELESIEKGFGELSFAVPFGEPNESCIIKRPGESGWYDPRNLIRLDFYPNGNAQWMILKLGEDCNYEYLGSGVITSEVVE